MSQSPARHRAQALDPTVGPGRQGLYDPAFRARRVWRRVRRRRARARAAPTSVQKGLTALRNLDHRGASGSDPDTGDGAGILVQMPDAFLREVVDFPLPPAGQYAAGIVFLPRESASRDEVLRSIARLVRQEGLTLLGWREVPVVSEIVGRGSREVEPLMRQIFLVAGRRRRPRTGAARFLRAQAARARGRRLLASLSCRTIVYKGMLTTNQLPVYFPDLYDPRFASAIALVHSRFSTNTFPSWPLAHPYRYVAHNGEINTVRGNRNWMSAREALLRSDLIAGDLERLFPICTPGRATRPASTRCSSCCTSAGAACPTPS